MNTFEMKDVESSQIDKIGYDKETEKLRVQFKNGGFYDYSNVPPEVHRALMAASSVGSFFSTVIKKNSSYPFVKV